jgi:hypothetical protein
MIHDSNDLALRCDPALERHARAAANELEHDALSALPSAGVSLVAWLRSLAPGGDIAAYYLHPIAFPMLRFARWLDEDLDGRVDEALEGEIVRSTMAGYAFIRLIDDVMDASPRGRPDLLPALAFLHTRFDAPYRRLFGDDAELWAEHARIWSSAGDAAIADAHLGDLDEAAFLRFAAGKVGAARLPLYAVARRHGLAAIPAPWERLVARMSAWHQMYNDTFDWAEDFARGASTYVLCEGRRRAVGGDVPGWFATRGLSWSLSKLDGWMREMQAIASDLRAPALRAYLEARARHVQGIAEELAPTLPVLAELSSAGAQAS